MENIVEVKFVHQTHLLTGLAGVNIEVVGVGAGGGDGEDLPGQESEG